MFCIAAFIVLVILSIFSARHRRMLGKAWGCVARRVTFRPCDTNFKEEVKSKLLSKVALKNPKLVNSADIALEIAAVAIIILTVWSLFVVVKSGVNLYVYGTCNPSNSASCSLGSEACSIETVRPSFVSSLTSFQVHTWFANEMKDFGRAVATIPTRMQNWEAKDYVPANATYYKPFDASKQVALDIIDPGCQFCRQLYINQKEAGFQDRYNLTYITYPIPSQKESSGYKFPNSLLVAQYLEAVRMSPLKDAKTPADWVIIDRLFNWKDNENADYQLRINSFYDAQQTKDLLQTWLKDLGYSEEQIAIIDKAAASKEVADIIAKNRETVEKKIKTVKIPTLIYDGKRTDGVQSVDSLR